MATNRLTVDRRDYKSLVLGVYRSSLQKEFAIGVHHSSSSGVVRTRRRYWLCGIRLEVLQVIVISRGVYPINWDTKIRNPQIIRRANRQHVTILYKYICFIVYGEVRKNYKLIIILFKNSWRDTLYPLKLALTSLTGGDRSIGIVR
jgi:hypothetical protein